MAMRPLKISKSITERSFASLNTYLNDISRHKLLSPDEEYALALRVKNWDKKAAEKLAVANLRFVVSIAKQYQNQWLTVDDLINEGNLWLMKAVEKFDPTKWFKFISYAVRWIRQSILSAIAENSRVVRLPLNRVGWISKVKAARMKFEQEQERDPTAAELAEILNIPEKHINTALANESFNISLDASVLEDEDTTLLEVYVDRTEKSTDHALSYTESLKKDVMALLDTLSTNQWKVLKLYFGISTWERMTIDDIAKELEMNVWAVRSIKDKWIIRLRKYNKSQLLEKYLG